MISFLIIGKSSYILRAEEAAKSRGGNCLLCAKLKDFSQLVRVSTTVVFISSVNARMKKSISSEMRPPRKLDSGILG